MYKYTLTGYRLAIPVSKGIERETADKFLNLEYKSILVKSVITKKKKRSKQQHSPNSCWKKD